MRLDEPVPAAVARADEESLPRGREGPLACAPHLGVERNELRFEMAKARKNRFLFPFPVCITEHLASEEFVHEERPAILQRNERGQRRVSHGLRVPPLDEPQRVDPRKQRADVIGSEERTLVPASVRQPHGADAGALSGRLGEAARAARDE